MCERVEKTAFMAAGGSFEELTDEERLHEIELLAVDSHPKLKIPSVKLEDVWVDDDGVERIKISGEKKDSPTAETLAGADENE